MSKKAKSKRKDLYQAFMDGMIKYRDKFLTKKHNLIEKMFSDDALKEKLMKKERTAMNKLERAAVDTIISKEIKNVEEFTATKDKVKEEKLKKAKFKYTTKKY